MRERYPRCRETTRGSAAVELVVVTPLWLALLALFVVGGQLLLARQEVDDAARTAVEAATTAQSGAAAVSLARSEASRELTGDVLHCAHLNVSTDTANFRPGGTVNVTVSCSVKIPALLVPGLPTSVELSASQAAVIEPYRAVQP